MIITKEQINEINVAFDRMLADTNLQKMATAMNVLCPNRKFYVTPDMLRDDIRNSKNITMDNWGFNTERESVSVDLDAYESSGAGTMGYLLQLCLDKETDEWHWELNLEIKSQWIYNIEENK